MPRSTRCSARSRRRCRTQRARRTATASTPTSTSSPAPASASCRASSSPSGRSRSTTGRSATPPGSASSSPARFPPATATSSPTPSRSPRSARRGSTCCTRCGPRARGRRFRNPRASSRHSRAAPPATSGSPSGARAATSRRSTSPGSVDTATQTPAPAARPGADLARLLPQRRLVHVGDPRPQARPRLSLQRPAARLPDPGAVRRVRAPLADAAEPPRRQRARDPARRHRPQRRDRVGLHLGALRRRRPLRREAHRPGDLRVQGRAAADGVPRRDLHLEHAGHRPAGPDRRPRPAVRPDDRADLPHGPRPGPVRRRRRRARAPLRDLEARAGDDRRHRASQRRRAP